MTARNGKDGTLSAEGEDRLRRELRHDIEHGQSGEGCDGDADVAQTVGCQDTPLPNAHYLAGSAFLTLVAMLWFVLAAVAMSARSSLSATYLAWGAAGYVAPFAFGFLMGRRDAGRCGPGCMPWVFMESRMAVLLVVSGFMVHGAMAGGAAVREVWEPPLLWAPAILWPVIVVGGALEGIVLGGIAGALPRRALWHALRCVVSRGRRAAAVRTQRRTGP